MKNDKLDKIQIFIKNKNIFSPKLLNNYIIKNSNMSSISFFFKYKNRIAPNVPAVTDGLGRQ
jgi:hypothetical protein